MSRESNVEFSILFIKPPCELSFSSHTEYLKIFLSHRLKNLPSCQGSGLLILTEGRERELEDLVASQWNLPDPPIRSYSILLTPLIDSQFSTVSNLYSVSNDWYPPLFPMKNMWSPCAWDKWWLIPNSLCSETVMSVFLGKVLWPVWSMTRFAVRVGMSVQHEFFLFLLIHVYFTFSFY